MYKQGDLWGESEKSPEEAKAEAAEAMARAPKGTQTRCGKPRRRVIYRLAQSGTLFTTDEVMTIMGKSGHTTHEPRALGPIVRRATSKGVIKRTGDYAKSTRRHSSEIPVYVGGRAVHG